MRVGAINNNLYPQNSKIGFQGGKIDTTQRLVKTAVQIAENSAPPMTEAKYKQIIKTLIKSPYDLKRIKDEMATETTIKKLEKTITSKRTTLVEQKKAIKKVFGLKDTAKGGSQEIVKDHINKQLVPFIVRTKNKDLANYVLKITKIKKVVGFGDIISRLKLIENLGGKKHIKEVGNIVSFAETKFAIKTSDSATMKMYNSEINDTHRMLLSSIHDHADKTIEKLKLTPNF